MLRCTELFASRACVECNALVLVLVVSRLVLVHHGEKRERSVAPGELLENDTLIRHHGEIYAKMEC